MRPLLALAVPLALVLVTCGTRSPGTICSPSTCAGCCSGGECLDGTLSSSCGTGGAACLTCSATQHCSSGVCLVNSTCPGCSGCCTSAGLCLPRAGQTASTCGRDAAACEICPAAFVCVDGVCLDGRCNASTCPTGCCDGNASCVSRTQQTDFLCGSGGDRCTGCAIRCRDGACVPCDAASCANGCCAGDFCHLHPDQNAAGCGLGGAACAPCPPGTRCGVGHCVPLPDAGLADGG